MQRLWFGLALSLLTACAAPAATLDATAPDVASEGGAADRVPSADRPAAADTAADTVVATDTASGPDVGVDGPSADASDAMTLGPDVLLADASADAPVDAPTDVTGTTPPDFMLPDLNPASRTHRMTIVPSAQRGVLSVWYFASATWGFCGSQFGFLDTMQTEINRAMPRTPVRITAINAIGAESGVESVLMGRTLPLVQDSAAASVASRWGAQVRQLWVCDPQGRVVEVTDLGLATLAEPMNYNAVRDRILARAR